MKVLVTDPLAPEALELLKAKGHEVVAKKLTPEELLVAIGQYDALLVRSETKVTKAVIEAGSPKLKVVGRAGVGVDNIDTAAAKERGITVVNAPLAATNAVAEITIGQMLNLARHLTPADVSTRGGKWEKKAFMGTELQGKTLGLIGVGRIGARVAEIARVFGMKIVAYDPYVDEARAKGMGASKVATVAEVVREADYVSVHTPLTAETKNLVNADLLAQFKKGAYLLNVARGGIVDEQAVYESIAKGHLGGAALDVFATEPLKGSPLLDAPAVRLTPHLGASTTEAQLRAGTQVVEQVLKALAGETPDFKVV